MSHLVRNDVDGLHTGAVQVALELAGLDELVFVDVLLHLVDGRHEVVVDAVHLVIALRSRRVCTQHSRHLTTVNPTHTLQPQTSALYSDHGYCISLLLIDTTVFQILYSICKEQICTSTELTTTIALIALKP